MSEALLCLTRALDIRTSRTILSGPTLTYVVLSIAPAPDTQLRFHKQQPSVSTYPAERCRLELHATCIAVSVLHIAYFSMVLGGELLLSVAVLGVVQIPISISAAILVSRMWMYT